MNEQIKLIHTTNGVKTICKECGEEIMSINHGCWKLRNQGGKDE